MSLKKIFFFFFIGFNFSLFSQDLSEKEQIKVYNDYAAKTIVTTIVNFNKNTRFLPYPYAEKGDNFFVREKSLNYENAKSFYGTVESSFVKGLNQDYLGNETKIQFLFLPILGIKAENILFANSDHSYDGNFKLGIEVPILLFDYFNLGLDTFWSLMYYDSVKNYCCAGFDVKSYFIKPVLLEGSIHFHGYNELIPEYSAQFGFFIESLNIFAGWKYLRGNCFYIGARRYF